MEPSLKMAQNGSEMEVATAEAAAEVLVVVMPLNKIAKMLN